jgi:hypothetical protein
MAARSAWSTQGNYTLPTCAPCGSSKRWNENIHQLTNPTCQCCPIAPAVSASRPCSGQAAAGPPTYEHLMALDETVVQIAGNRMYLGCAVDHEGKVIDMLFQRTKTGK